MLSFPFPLRSGIRCRPAPSLRGPAGSCFLWMLVPPLPAAFPTLGWVIALVPPQLIFPKLCFYSLRSWRFAAAAPVPRWAPVPRTPQQNPPALPGPGSKQCNSVLCLCKHGINATLYMLFVEKNGSSCVAPSVRACCASGWCLMSGNFWFSFVQNPKAPKYWIYSYY